MASRCFDAQRQADGFRSQAHLDAFYRYYDHATACSECGQPGEPTWLNSAASWQPTVTHCPTGHRLQRLFLLVGVLANFRAHRPEECVSEAPCGLCGIQVRAGDGLVALGNDDRGTFAVTLHRACARQIKQVQEES